MTETLSVNISDGDLNDVHACSWTNTEDEEICNVSAYDNLNGLVFYAYDDKDNDRRLCVRVNTDN